LLETAGLTTKGSRVLPSTVANDVYLAAGFLFVETADRKLHCLKQDEMLSDQWSLDGASLAGRPLPTPAGPLLPLVDGRVLTVHPQSGEVIATVQTGQGLGGGPFLVGADVFVPTRDGSLVRLTGAQP
jgi:hypothetical protein